MRFCFHCMEQIENEYMTVCPQCGKSLTEEKRSPRYLAPGSILAKKYIVGYPLGDGGFGITYIGWDFALKRKVAIKEFFPRHCAVRAPGSNDVNVVNAQAVSKFKNGKVKFLEEARNIASLGNIYGVVNILAHFEQNYTAYIAMEYLEGKTLKSLLQEFDQLRRYQWGRRVILSVLYTLRELHKRGVLHRDIAPDNIMITNDGAVKLIDFGTAKHAFSMDDAEGELSLKVGYAPIEQYIRNSAQGPYTDMYEVAALFYRMLTGQTPLPADVRQQNNDDPIPPSEMGIAVPPKAEQAIMACLRMYAPSRLQSAEAFMECLDGKNYVPHPIRFGRESEPKSGSDSEPGMNRHEKDREAHFPLWAKVMVAVILCFTIIEGAVWGVRLYGGKNVAVMSVSDNLELPDFTDCTVAEVQEKLNEMGYDGITVQLSKNYNSDDTKSDIVFDQYPEAANDLDVNSLENWSISEGKLTGVMTLYVYSNDVITYGELKNLNAYSLAMKLGWDVTDSVRFEMQEAEKNYFSIMGIDLKQGADLTIDEIEKGEDDTELVVNDIEKIRYCAGDIFYQSRLGNYVGKNIQDETYAVHQILEEGGKPVPTGELESLGNQTMLYDDRYYSFQYDKGYIFEQTVDADAEVDTSKGIAEPIFHVVRLRIETEGKTGSEVVEKLRAMGLVTKSNIQFDPQGGSKADIVESVKIYEGRDVESDKEITAFYKGQAVLFVIRTVKPSSKKNKSAEQQQEPSEGPMPAPTPTPVPAPVPTPAPAIMPAPETDI